MSMRGLIIANQIIGHNEYKIKRLTEEFLKENIEVNVFINDGTLAFINNDKVDVNLPSADFVIYLDKDIYLARLLEKAGYRLFNKADFIKTCDDKTLTSIKCANLGIKMPDTFAGPLVYTSNENPDTKFLDKVISQLGFPMVVKKVYGSLGEGVFLAENRDQLFDLYKKECHNPILFQKYEKNSNGKSVRVLIIDGKVFGGFERINDGDFRSNFGISAGSKNLDNPEKYFSFAQKIANSLDIEYAGIDLLDGEDNEPVLCEINSNAFFEEFEKRTGLNVAEAIVKMIIKKTNNNE